MKRSAIFVFGLLWTLAADAALAAEVQFSCNYELGTDTSAQRRKIGSVVVAIDVDAKMARIDFGKGWFKPMSLEVDGTDVKETSPPSNGNELGYFYFDLTVNSGGFKSESDPHEFFDACMRMSAPGAAQSAEQSAPPASAAGAAPSNEATVAASPSAEPPSAPPVTAQTQIDKPGDKTELKKAVPAPLPQVAQLDVPKAPPSPPLPQAEPPAMSPPAAEKTPPPPAAVTPVLPPPSEAVAEKDSPPAEVHGATEYFGDKNSNVDLGPVIKAPATQAEEPRAAVRAEAAPVPTAPEPQPAVEPGTTQYFGDTSGPKSPMPPAAFVAQIEAPKLAPSQAPPAAPVHEAALESCRDTLDAEARSAKVNFENSSFTIDPGGQTELRKIARMMKACGAASVEVGGHADNLGDHSWNKTLSKLRADAVVNFLVGEGATASSLKAVGYGDAQPVATNDTDEGRRSNRRVELRVSAP